MQTAPLPPFRALPVGFIFVFALLTAGREFAAHSVAPTASSPSAKTHVLFMGADLSLEKAKAVHPIVDVTANYMVIKPAGKPVKVPLEETSSLHINESLKIAEGSVGIEGLKADRAYSRAADPLSRLARTAALAAGQSASVDQAGGAALTAHMQVVVANAMVANASSPAAAADAARAQDQAEASQAAAELALRRALDAPTSDIYDVGSQSVKAFGDEMFDAIRISFEVTPEKNLERPYYGIIAQIRERGSKPGHVRKWAYVQSLGPMSAGVPRHVNIYQSGMPSGYTLESCEVHFYDAGGELATNLSRKRVPLTDDEAQQYRIIEYISANKGRTLPAVPATTKLPREGRAQLEPGQLSDTYYVRVTKDGKATHVFRDHAGKQPLQNAQLESVLQAIRFKPALEAGKPVESVAPLKLSDLPPM